MFTSYYVDIQHVRLSYLRIIKLMKLWDSYRSNHTNPGVCLQYEYRYLKKKHIEKSTGMLRQNVLQRTGDERIFWLNSYRRDQNFIIRILTENIFCDKRYGFLMRL
jgi:hypothetical protein